MSLAEEPGRPGAATSFRRRVSPVEWWLVAHPHNAAPVLQIVVEAIGRLDAATLTSAVASASQACPGARLRRDRRTWVDSGIAPAVRVVALAPGQAVTDLATLQDSLSVTGGPTCEVLLVEGERTSVVFRAGHAVMDAHGVLLWAGDVFRALRGEPLLGASDTTTELDVLTTAADPDVEQAPPPGLDVPALLGARDPQAGRAMFWRRRTVDGYHPALIARLASVLAADCGSPTARFSIPVDLRRHVPDVRSTASLSHGVPFEVPAGQSWQDTHEQLLTLLADRRDTEVGLPPEVLKVPVPALRSMNVALESEAVTKNRYASHASLSHLGRVELAGFCAPGFEATGVYSLSMSPIGGPVEFDVVECGGHTELTVTWHDAPGAAQRAEVLLDGIEEALSPKAWRTWSGNDTAGPPADARTVVEQFVERARSVPDSVAVSGPDGELTYRELDVRSRAVAYELHTRGVGRDEPVGVLTGRSAAAMVAIWGVLRAGAAYLPLEVTHPDARLSGVLNYAGARTCLVETPYGERGLVPEGCESLPLAGLPDAPDAWVEPSPAPDDLAYVMYTSGSTGRPKGVEIEHRSLANYVDWAGRALAASDTMRLPLLTSLGFDVSCTSIFVPLLAGGTMLLPSGPLSHATLRDLIGPGGATVLSMTPAVLELVCELTVDPPEVSAVLVAGELLSRGTALRAQEMFGPACRVINAYGPTEATVEVTMHTFDADRDVSAGVSIGRPTANCAVYLLDGQGRFVAPGATGELCLGGVQLARGYRGRPDLTRERFVRLADGQRVYRSGDLGRVAEAGGGIDYIGRVDDQVKVRGHRIEPAEIVHVLEQDPGVQRAAVVVRGRGPQGTKALCAYVIAAGELDRDRLMGTLAARLPVYMLPAAICVVPEIPHNSNGKVDPRALPDPFAESEVAPLEAADTDEVTSAVAQVWAATLGVPADRLGADSDFYQLGGNSLLLLSMIAGVCDGVLGQTSERAFLKRLGDIVAEPTIARTADILRDVRGDHAPRSRTVRPVEV